MNQEEELIRILKTMDLPEERIARKDWRWFLRNIRIRNENHPDIQKAILVLKELLKK